ncbi:hypothetical protein K523DRAFT_414285 [Schizophyllum commune Tattone D]|nr:hypothetical protein K523DRAFT_414285 [Schizophyllum commune Tattone D]
MTVVNPLRYALSAGDNIAWTATQEKQILKDVPWNDIGQSDEQAGQEDDQVLQKPRNESLNAESFIARTYLQYLWLPESIMPLHGLVYALRRIVHANPADTNAPHTLHALIEPLLLTARSAAHKYHIELTAILAEGGGAGEAEEAMMWFAYEHEKHEAASSTGGQPSNSQQSNDPESNEDADAQWQARWLNRMERREAQIQILLYLLKLSLPPSPTADLIASPAKKHAAAMQQDVLLSPRKGRRVEPYEERRRVEPAEGSAHSSKRSEDQVASTSSQSSPRKRRRKSPEPAPLAPEVYLEAFMDKLSMWQLVRGLDDDRRSEGASMPAGLRAKPNKGGATRNGKTRQDDERDWMQVFCEDVVEPLFKPTLPELCALLRSKVFPHSPFSDEESDDEDAVFGGSQAVRGGSQAQRARSQTYDEDDPFGSQDPFSAQAFDDPFDSYSARSQTHDDRSDRARSKSRASSFGDWLSSDPDEWQDDEETVRAATLSRASSRAPTLSRASSRAPAPSLPPSRAASLARTSSSLARTSSSSGVARTSSSANMRASGSQSRASSSKPHASVSSSQSHASTSRTSQSQHARQLARARSMSLSQSLAQEEADRAAGAGVKRKREISREVSMSRILRPGKSARGDRGDTPGSRSLTPMVEDARTKEKTREKAKEKKEKELGSVLVGDTPVKKATKVFS